MQLRAEPEIKDYILSLGIKTSLGPVRVPARKDSLMLGRICFPVRSQGILLGYLWLIDDDESLIEQEIDESARVAAVVGEILLRNQLTDDLRRTREREPLLDLVNDASTFHDHLTTEALRFGTVNALPTGRRTGATGGRGRNFRGRSSSSGVCPASGATSDCPCPLSRDVR